MFLVVAIVVPAVAFVFLVVVFVVVAVVVVAVVIIVPVKLFSASTSAAHSCRVPGSIIRNSAMTVIAQKTEAPKVTRARNGGNSTSIKKTLATN